MLTRRVKAVPDFAATNIDRGEEAPVTDKPIAIVTGVGPGTGSAIARRFASGGFRVIALPARRILSVLSSEAVICDVSSESQVASAVADVRESYGSPSILVHNAVGGGWGTFLEIDPHLLEANFRVNVMGLLYLARELAPTMIEAGRGTVLVTGNTSSTSGRVNFAGFAPTKAAQRILAESIARDLGPRGIHVAYLLIDAVINDSPNRRTISSSGRRQSPTSFGTSTIRIARHGHSLPSFVRSGKDGETEMPLIVSGLLESAQRW
jgi:NAD(P)-dependent dehydrogenase (short-subunit alcohol dehydrogenase family)